MSRRNDIPPRTYRLEFVNEDTRHKRRLRLTRARLIVLTAAVVAVMFVVGAALVTLTPIKRIMPWSVDSDMRSKYVEMSLKMDSINSASRMNDAYLANVLSILGESAESSVPDSVKLVENLPLDSLMSASEEERQFVNRYKENEQFNLSVLSPIAADAMVFYPPVTGAIISHDKKAINQVKVNTIGATPVSSVYKGTVVDCHYDSNGYVVLIQHPNNFISEYTGLTDLFTEKGKKVNAGTKIGMANTSRYPLYFELWHNGTPIDPENHIKF